MSKFRELGPAQESKKWTAADKRLWAMIKTTHKAKQAASKLKQKVKGQDYAMTDYNLLEMGDKIKRWAHNHADCLVRITSAKNGKLEIEITGRTIPTKEELMQFRGIKGNKNIDRVEGSGNHYTIYSKKSGKGAMESLMEMDIATELFGFGKKENKPITMGGRIPE